MGRLKARKTQDYFDSGRKAELAEAHPLITAKKKKERTKKKQWAVPLVGLSDSSARDFFFRFLFCFSLRLTVFVHMCYYSNLWYITVL